MASSLANDDVGSSENKQNVEEIFPGSPKNTSKEDVVLEIRNLRKYFPLRSSSIIFSKVLGYVKAVDGIRYVKSCWSRRLPWFQIST